MGEAKRREEIEKDPIRKKHAEFTSMQITIQQIGQTIQQIGGMYQGINVEYQRQKSMLMILQNLMNDMVNDRAKIKETTKEDGSISKEIDLMTYVEDFNKLVKDAQDKQEAEKKVFEEEAAKVNEVNQVLPPEITENQVETQV
jgi:hypothetical protein